MTIRCSDTELEPTHHIKLSSGSNEIGLILCDGNGNPYERGFARTPMNQSGLKMYSGQQKHSDMEPPWTPLSQTDWSGGMGLENADVDTTRYAESMGVYALKSNEIILAGMPEYTLTDDWSIGISENNWSRYYGGTYRNYTKYLLDDTTKYATKFTASSAIKVANVHVVISYRGTPAGNLTLALYSDSGGSPNTLLKSDTINVAAFGDYERVWKEVVFSWAEYTLTADTVYWIVVSSADDTADTNCWELLLISNGSDDISKISTDGGAYATDAVHRGIMFYLAPARDDYKAYFAEYKGGLVKADNYDDGGAGGFGVCGDVGVADANSTTTKLYDTRKLWTADIFNGSICVLVSGTGATQRQNWRVITDNDGTTLTFSEAFDIAPSDDTYYVIVNAITWNQDAVPGLTGYWTDLLSANGALYFAQGDSTDMKKLQIYNKANTYIYLANNTGGLHTYTVSAAGVLTHVDSDDQGGVAYGVWGDGKFIYLANGTGGLLTYSVNAAGELTYIDSDVPDAGKEAFDVCGDGNFIYLANDDTGLHVYTVSAAGVLTHVDSDDQGDNAYGVWGDGNFIYLANGTGGLHVYSVSAAGELTHADSDDQGGQAYGVWGDGNFIYLANGDDGLHVYSVDGSGELTHVDDYDGGDNYARRVWGDGNFIYLAYTLGGINSFSVSAAGELTLEDTEFIFGTSPYSVWGDGNFVYIANYATGLHTYTVDGSGELTHVDSDDQGDYAYGVWGDSKISYSDDTETDNQYSMIIAGVDLDGNCIYGAKRTTPKVYRADAVDATGTAIASDLSFAEVGFAGEAGSRINSLVNYGDYGFLHLLKQDGIWELYDSVFYEKRIPEMHNTLDDRNGQSVIQHGVYLYFSWHNTVLRYYDGNLDNIGPNSNELYMDADRQGNIVALAGYPGMIFAAVDGGKNNISSVLAYNMRGWHEIWRAPEAGRRVYNLHVQSIDGDMPDLLWVNCGSDIIKIPISSNPYNHPEGSTDYEYYPFIWGGYLDTSWYTASFYDVVKYWHSIKMNVEGSGNWDIYILYKLDNASTWTYLGHTDSSRKEIDLSSSYDVDGYRIKFRFVINTDDNKHSPRILSTVLDTMLRFPLKYESTITFRVRDNDVDLCGNPDDTTTANAKLNLIDTWSNQATPVTVNAVATVLDGKYAFVDSPQMQPDRFISAEGEEYYIGRLRLVEVN